MNFFQNDPYIYISMLVESFQTQERLNCNRISRLCLSVLEQTPSLIFLIITLCSCMECIYQRGTSYITHICR